MRLLDAETTFGENVEGLYLHHSQIITDEFLEALKSERMAKEAVRCAELDRVASVPTFVLELWLRQGFPVYQMTAEEVVAKLNADDLQSFICTPKRV